MNYPNYFTPEEHLTEGKKRLDIRDVVVLCGSMRFAPEMVEAAIAESVAGALVLKPDCNMKLPHPLWADPVEAEALKTRLDDQHRQKIRLADRVIVVGDYIGDSTRAEIAYARELGKPVRFTHPEVDPGGPAAVPAVAVITADEIELEGGDVMLQELSVGDPIEIEKQTGPLSPGTWKITGFAGGDRSRARVRRMTREEIEAARRGEAFSRIYE